MTSAESLHPNLTEVNLISFHTADISHALLSHMIARYDRRLEIADLPMSSDEELQREIKERHIGFLNVVMRCLQSELVDKTTETAKSGQHYLTCHISAERTLPVPSEIMGTKVNRIWPTKEYGRDYAEVDHYGDEFSRARIAHSMNLDSECDLERIICNPPSRFNPEFIQLSLRIWRKSQLEPFTLHDFNIIHYHWGNRYVSNQHQFVEPYMLQGRQFLPGRMKTITAADLINETRPDMVSPRQDVLIRAFSLEGITNKDFDIEGSITIRYKENYSANRKKELEIDPIEIRNTPDLWQDKYDDMLTGIIMRRELEARLEFSAIAAKPQPVVLTSMETMP